jgi:IK cytokine
VEHTHLVKGLDFALLQKTRTEMTKKRDDKGEEQDDVEEDKKAKQKQKQAEDAKKADEKKKIKMSFRTQTARTIHNILTGTFHRAIPVREQFQQGRTQFLYELTGSDGFDIPTVVIRAKEDCPRFGDQVSNVFLFT